MLPSQRQDQLEKMGLAAAKRIITQIGDRLEEGNNQKASTMENTKLPSQLDNGKSQGNNALSTVQESQGIQTIDHGLMFNGMRWNDKTLNPIDQGSQSNKSSEVCLLVIMNKRRFKNTLF